jgi:plasmid maintenance system antidote protein VapI
MVRVPTYRPPPHPGAMLRGEFFVPGGLSDTAFAWQLDVPVDWLRAFLCEGESVTPALAAQLARDPDTVAELLDDAWIAATKRRMRRMVKLMTTRVDQDVLECYRSPRRGHRARMDVVRRGNLESHEEPHARRGER